MTLKDAKTVAEAFSQVEKLTQQIEFLWRTAKDTFSIGCGPFRQTERGFRSDCYISKKVLLKVLQADLRAAQKVIKDL